jgi:hypothetical protein
MSNIDQRPENVRGMIGICLRLTANRKIKPTTSVSLNCLATVDIRRPGLLISTTITALLGAVLWLLLG